MTRDLLRAVAVAAATACAASAAWSIDLAEAYRLASERDATIRASRATSEAGRERLPQARASLLPSVSINSSRFKNDLDSKTPNPLVPGQEINNQDRYNSNNDTFVIRQPLFRKALTAQYRSAEAVAADANATLERDEQSLVVRVTGAYFEALLAEDQLELIGLQKAAYAGQVDAATKAFRAGAGTRTDIDDAQARYDLAVAQEVEARENVDLTRRQLQVLIDQPVTTLSKLNVSRMQLTPPAPATTQEWLSLAEAASPELMSARAQVEAARADVDKARSGHYPTLDAVAQVSRSTSENVTRLNTSYYQKQIGVQLTVPIFQGGYVNSQAREALALLERSESRLEELRRDLGVRIHKEFKGVTEGVLKVRALEQAVRSSEQVLVSTRRSFEAGARTRIDILNAEQQAGQARRDLSQARLTYMLSRVRLKALAGGLKVENIDEMNGWLQH
ncbi:TolC family outer membrane protein [Ramlibacter solisilvae]|uniref:Channel protein TolC n=1 Tax=Ramlibacter tataouinensis TaxID=94132 RepID=A0A127K0A9_9BURK|nr:TolC family outer membrane protein [Ramlibacter tataouinensis]AMO23842.1 channel protein TolC [Ramlibacter tataouinensis]